MALAQFPLQVRGAVGLLLCLGLSTVRVVASCECVVCVCVPSCAADVFEPVSIRHFDFVVDSYETEIVTEAAGSSRLVSSPSVPRAEGEHDVESVHSRMTSASKAKSTSSYRTAALSHAPSLLSVSSSSSAGAMPRPRLSAIQCGHSHVLARDSKGGMWAWGSNAHGQVVQKVHSNVLRPRQIDLRPVMAEGDKYAPFACVLWAACT